VLSLLYSTALFLSNSAEAPRAPAYAPSFCRRTDCNCSPYRTASTQQNTLARRPLRMFLPSDTPAANRSLIDTLTCQHPRAESRFLFTPPARFSARRYAGCTRSLIYVLTCHNMRWFSFPLHAAAPIKTTFPDARLLHRKHSLAPTPAALPPAAAPVV